MPFYAYIFLALGAGRNGQRTFIYFVKLRFTSAVLCVARFVLCAGIPVDETLPVGTSLRLYGAAWTVQGSNVISVCIRARARNVSFGVLCSIVFHVATFAFIELIRVIYFVLGKDYLTFPEGRSFGRGDSTTPLTTLNLLSCQRTD